MWHKTEIIAKTFLDHRHQNSTTQCENAITKEGIGKTATGIHIVRTGIVDHCSCKSVLLCIIAEEFQRECQIGLGYDLIIDGVTDDISPVQLIVGGNIGIAKIPD